MVKLALLLCLAAPPLRAQEVLAVLSSDLSSYKEGHAGFMEKFGPGAGVRRLAEGGFAVPPETRIIVAFGRKAAERDYPARVKVIACLAPGLTADWAGGRTGITITMLPPADHHLSVLKGVQPGLKRLTVLWSGSSYGGYVERLRQASAAHGLAIRAQRVDGAEDLPDILRSLTGETDALWLAPDPNFLTAYSFGLIVNFGQASGLPVYVSVPGLAEKGAAASTYVSHGESGRFAAAIARDMLTGAVVESPVYPAKTETILNLSAAKKYGLSIPADAVTRATGVLP